MPNQVKTAAPTSYSLSAPDAPDKSWVGYRDLDHYTPDGTPGMDVNHTGIANRYNAALGYQYKTLDGVLHTEDEYAADRAHHPDMGQDMLLGQISGEFMKDRDQAGTYNPDQIAAQQASYNDPGQIERYNAADAGTAAQYKAALMDKPQDVGIGQLTPVAQVQSQGVGGPGAAAIAGMDRVQGANLDTSHADRVQSQQDNYLQALEARSRGEAPSVAESAYSAKMGDIANNAQGIAAQARGSDKAYARLHAMDTIADQGRKAAFESAQLRAGEMDSASNALGSQLGNVRGQDVDTAKTAAQLQQEANLANQRTASTTEQYNSGAINSQNQFDTGVQERSADRAQAASAANATAGNARTMDEAQLRATTDANNAARGLTANQYNATAQNAASADNMAATNARQALQSQQQTAANAANAGAYNARADFTSTGQNQTSQFNAGQRQTAQGANQTAGLQAEQLNEATKQGLAQDALNATQQQTGLIGTRLNAPGSTSTFDRALSAGTTLGAAGIAASDERIKKDIKGVDDDAASRLAKALEFKEFKYKDDPNETNHVGVMAQDLEKDPLGRKLVHENDEGVKHVDYAGLTQLLLAAALRGKKEARQ